MRHILSFVCSRRWWLCARVPDKPTDRRCLSVWKMQRRTMNEQTIKHPFYRKTNWLVILTSHTPSPLLPPAHILLSPASPLICEHMSLLTIGMTTVLSASSCPVSERREEQTTMLLNVNIYTFCFNRGTVMCVKARWWKKAVLFVSPHPYMVQLVPSAIWHSFTGRWMVEAPSDTGAGLQKKR